MKYLTCCILLVSISFITGCAFSTYVPTTINTPLLKSEDEFHVSGGLSGNAYSAQIAYSPASNLGLIMNANVNKKINRPMQNLYYDRHFSGQIGVGYYNLFDNGSLYEGYLGLGYCSSTIKQTSFSFNEWFYTDEMSGKYTSLFVIQNYGIAIDSSVDAIFSLRASSIKYLEFYSVKPIVNTKLSTIVLEPGITVKYGWPSFKFVLQLTHPIPLHSNTVFDIEPFLFSLGVEVILPIKQ